MSVSTRVLRKIRGDQDALSKNKDADSDAEDLTFSPQPPRGNHVNRYNLLNDDSQSESEVKEDDDGDSVAKEGSKSNADSRRSKRKKKKKRKSYFILPGKHSSEDLDEIERSVREVNALLGATPSSAPATVETAVLVERGCLALDKKHLNAKNELKRIFGAEAVQANETSCTMRGRKRGLQKNLWLVQSRPHWTEQMKPGPSLSMKLMRTVNGIQYFKYEHSSNYQAVERKFLACVESMDPLQLIMITHSHPFHVNTVIQLSEICNMNEEYQSAAQLVERALYALEAGFHPQFNLSKGNCRLDYRHQENRALFIALFSHLRFVGLRACYRTALELCKLLLSLSPDEDPLAVVLAVDFYAIRSGEYKWLLEFIAESDEARRLSQLPSLALGRALAHFHLGELEEADQHLQDALIMFPGILLPLLDKCSVAPDAKTLASYFFVDAGKRQSPALTQLVHLYVGRSYHLWKEVSVLRWLERNTLAVIERVVINDPLIADYAAKRSKRFDCRTPRAVQRHVLLSDVPDVPLTESGTTYNFDPLPPLNTIDIYRGPRSPSERIEDLGNTFSLFFRSMMPTFSPQAAAAAPAVEGQPVANLDPPEEGAAGGASLRRSVNTLLDAMRDLITNLQAQNDADGESTDASDPPGNPPAQ